MVKDQRVVLRFETYCVPGKLVVANLGSIVEYVQNAVFVLSDLTNVHFFENEGIILFQQR